MFRSPPHFLIVMIFMGIRFETDAGRITKASSTPCHATGTELEWLSVAAWEDTDGR
jgi:hypothetical protein